MNINAIKFNETIKANQNTNNQNQVYYNKANSLQEDTVSFSALKPNAKDKEIRNIHLKLAKIIEDQTYKKAYPHYHLKNDMGLDSLELVALESEISEYFFNNDNEFNLATIIEKMPNQDMTLRELAEKIYNIKHARPKLCCQI